MKDATIQPTPRGGEDLSSEKRQGCILDFGPTGEIGIAL